jgi:hypothetical protein
MIFLVTLRALCRVVIRHNARGLLTDFLVLRALRRIVIRHNARGLLSVKISSSLQSTV